MGLVNGCRLNFSTLQNKREIIVKEVSLVKFDFFHVVV
jgi:hypothetical protein